MLLITEELDNELLYEAKEKELYIKGVFAQANTVNNNARIYPRSVMEQALSTYKTDWIDKKRAIGENNHPQTPHPDHTNASILIEDMHFDGDDVMGKAKVLNTPQGNILRGLIEGGVQVAVSTRGTGSLKKRNGINEVQSDYRFFAVDTVLNPGAPNAFVQGIMEGKEWAIGANGEITEIDAHRLEEHQMFIDKVYATKKASESKLLEAFNSIMSKV